MEWSITSDSGDVIVFMQCDYCNKPEARKQIIQKEWVFIEQDDHITNGYCGDECATSAEEDSKEANETTGNKTLQKEQAACCGV